MCVEVCTYEYINLKSHSYTSQEQADMLKKTVCE